MYERIVLAIPNASNPLAKLRNGKLKCYKQSTFTEEECKSHFSLFRNASVDVIFRMRNVSDLYFGTYLLSMYGGIDSEIKTLWIRVYNKGKSSSCILYFEYIICAVSGGCNGC